MNTKTLLNILQHGGKETVCIDENETFTADDLKRSVLSLAYEIDKHPEKKWLLWASSAYTFLQQFLALLVAQKHIVLPGNVKPGTIDLILEYFDWALVDEAIEHPALANKTLIGSDHVNGEQPFNIQSLTEQNFAPITLLTSGSTGHPKPVAKKWHHLITEISLLGELWNEQVARYNVLSTVSHQHIYGLLHYVLWPLLRKAPFINTVTQYPEELLELAQKHAPVVLISSPTHLKRLPQYDGFNHNKDIHILFSSTGRLEDETVKALKMKGSQPPFEVFGSTETGGVAWRQRIDESDTLWKPLPGVSVDIDQDSKCLKVMSPHITPNTYYPMSDRVKLFPNQSFEMLGRADKVVKVEGKRLSVTEMENRLKEHHWVTEAKVIVMTGKREEVCCLLELNENGMQALAENKKRDINTQFKALLAGYFETVQLPRKWRYTHAIARDSQGKITYDLISDYFLRNVE